MRLIEINNNTETLVDWANDIIVSRMRLVNTSVENGKVTLKYRNQITSDLAIIVIDARNQTMFDPDGFLLDVEAYTDERSFKRALGKLVRAAEDIE